MHLLICAIHSAFSVGVAANTAKDFFGDITCQPFFHAVILNSSFILVTLILPTHAHRCRGIVISHPPTAKYAACCTIETELY